ncbi:MAG: zinc-binding alcohol dehydrogenase family protein [Chthoniobacteraceae bacterium]
MKTCFIESAGKIGYGEAASPRVGPEDVLLKVKRVGYCGSDLNTYRGLNPLVGYPRIPGHELTAEIVETGKAVPATLRSGLLATVLPYTACGRCSACLAGRSNACRNNQTLGVQRDGALAEFISVPYDKVILSPKLSELELALVEPLSVGFHAVGRGQVTKADTVLVFGCGMIGLGAIASAGLECGARVIAVDIDDAKLELARQCGAAHTVNSRRENLETEVAEMTGGEGVNVVIEAVGLPQTYTQAVSVVAFAGRIVYIGYAKASVAYETKYFVMKELDIRGSRNATKQDFERVVAVLESGRYPSERTVTHTVPFAQAGEALEAWSRNPAAVTKIHVTL